MSNVPVPAALPGDPPTAAALTDLERRLDEAVHAGSATAAEKQHAKGRRTGGYLIASGTASGFTTMRNGLEGER